MPKRECEKEMSAKRLIIEENEDYVKCGCYRIRNDGERAR